MANKQELKYPFEYDSKEIREAEIIRRPKVKDRILASSEAKEVFGEQEGDAILICLLSQICRFGEEKIKIPAEILAEKMDYEDFLSLFSKLPSANSSGGEKKTLDRSSAN